MTATLPLLRARDRLTTPDGTPTLPFQNDWQTLAEEVELKATLASPTFTGIPAAPTAAADTNTTQLATTAYIIGQAYAKLASPTFTGTATAPTYNATVAYSFAGVQVLTARKTGWAADTGTAKRTANATYSGTAEAAYTQATVQGLMNAVRDATQTIKAMKDDLIAHGIIGA